MEVRCQPTSVSSDVSRHGIECKVEGSDKTLALSLSAQCVAPTPQVCFVLVSFYAKFLWPVFTPISLCSIIEEYGIPGGGGVEIENQLTTVLSYSSHDLYLYANILNRNFPRLPLRTIRSASEPKSGPLRPSRSPSRTPRSNRGLSTPN